MAIGIKGSSGSGEFKLFCKYDAKAGRMFRVDRVEGANGFESNPVDITQNAMFVADMPNLRVGWINYTTQGPIKVLNTLGKGAVPERPDGVDKDNKPLFKQGFEIDILLHKSCSGGTEGARDLSSTAGCVIEAVDALHDAYLVAPESKQGKLPVVKITATIPVKSGSGTKTSTNYKPVFEIATWVDRPPALAVNGHAEAPAAASRASMPPGTGSTQVAPPPAQKAPETVAAGDFG